MPRWVVAALVVRQAVAPMIGVRRAPRDVFGIREVADDEALVAADDAHLDFRCAIAVDEDTRMLRVTTTVRLHNAPRPALLRAGAARASARHALDAALGGAQLAPLGLRHAASSRIEEPARQSVRDVTDVADEPQGSTLLTTNSLIWERRTLAGSGRRRGPSDAP